VIRIVPLDAAHEGMFAELFAACASSCFCRWWHFEGSKNEWLARLAHEPEVNRDEHARLAHAGDPAAGGLLALEGDIAVGWMKLVPRSAVPKLRRLPVYRALDLGDDEGVWSVGCFLVRPDRRGTGVARALLAAADQHVRARAGRAIEAYPRRSSEPIHAEEAWMGPASLFLGQGFTPMHDLGPYPVLRKEVSPNP
jgi:GNAT superfamily N-acetyltransferase